MRRSVVIAVLCAGASPLWAENDLARNIRQDTGVKGGLVMHVG